MSLPNLFFPPKLSSTLSIAEYTTSDSPDIINLLVIIDMLLMILDYDEFINKFFNENKNASFS